MNAPSFRRVCQHTGTVATEFAARAGGAVLEALWPSPAIEHARALSHVLPDPQNEARMECDGPEATWALPDNLWHAQASAAGAGAEGPEAASVQKMAPASGHPASAGPPAAVDDPGPADLPSAGPGSPTVRDIEELLATIAAQHRDFHVTHTTWECLCGEELPQSSDVMATHERHIARFQAAALLEARAERDQPNSLQDMARADRRIAARLSSTADFFPQHSRK